MEVIFEPKPTGHFCKCALCPSEIVKGQYALKVKYYGYQTSEVARICIGCLRRGIQEGDSDE